MKRFILSVMMVIAAVVFGGCGVKSSVDSAKAGLDSAFECDMKVFYDDSEFDGRLRRKGTGEWDTEFTAPDTLAGVVLSFSGNDVSASYKGLAFTVPKKAMPVKSVLTNFMTAVDNLASEESIQGSGKDGVITVTGENEAGAYKLGIDSETGSLVSFEMKNLGAKMLFENMTVTSSEAVTESPENHNSETVQPDGSDMAQAAADDPGQPAEQADAPAVSEQ